MRLKYRLAGIFLLVVAIGSGTTFLLVRRSTESMFRDLVFTGDAEKAKVYATVLGGFYAGRGSWDGVQDFLAGMPALVSRMVESSIYGERAWMPFPGLPAANFRTLMADRIAVADLNGVIVADTAGRILSTVHPSRHLSHGMPVTVDFRRIGTVLVGSMIDSSLTGTNERFLESVTRSLLWSTFAAAGLALFLGILFAVRITKPLGLLAAAAKNVASGDFSAPVPVRGNDELAGLSVSFNVMVAELKRLDAAKKQVIADSAHELRTPVTLIQGTIEGMIDGIFPCNVDTLESVHEETLRLSRLIDTLRELEIIQSGELEVSMESVDIAETIRKAVTLFSASARAKHIALSFENLSPEPPVARGDYLRLGEVVYNLIANAIQYTPEGGAVRVRCETLTSGPISIRVDDSGKGIPVDERSRVFERFYRIDKSRSTGSGGRGLGLAIVAEIVKAHGGNISVGISDLGGASFSVTLPSA